MAVHVGLFNRRIHTHSHSHTLTHSFVQVRKLKEGKKKCLWICTHRRKVYSCFSSSSLPFRKNRVGSRVGFSRKRRRISFAPLQSPPFIYSDTLTAYTHTHTLWAVWRGTLSLIFISSGGRWMCKFDIINSAAKKKHGHRTRDKLWSPPTPPPLWLFLVFTFIPFFFFKFYFIYFSIFI